MKKFNDPVEDALNGFRAGWKSGADPEAKLQPWAKSVLYFCLAVVFAAGGLVLYSQLAQ